MAIITQIKSCLVHVAFGKEYSSNLKHSSYFSKSIEHLSYAIYRLAICLKFPCMFKAVSRFSVHFGHFLRKQYSESHYNNKRNLPLNETRLNFIFLRFTLYIWSP